MSRSKALQYYIIARLLLAPLMLGTITTIVFLLLRATPGDPADAILGGHAPEVAKQQLRKQLGLDLPLWLQYLNYLGQLLHLDLGTSLTSRGQPVWDVIGQYFPATLELAVCSMAIALIVGIYLLATGHHTSAYGGIAVGVILIIVGVAGMFVVRAR